MTSFHANKGVDYHLRSLGFQSRDSLEVISMDNVRFANDRVIAQPDWVIKCSRLHRVYVIDYKNRASGAGPTQREMWQLLCYSWVVPEYLSWIDETNVILPVTAGILFGDNQRYDIRFTDEELYKLQSSVIPAIKAYKEKGLLRKGQKISATFLANYIVDPTLASQYTSSSSARYAGTLAHKAMIDPSIVTSQ